MLLQSNRIKTHRKGNQYPIRARIPRIPSVTQKRRFERRVANVTGSTREYNKAGTESRTYYAAGEDPCGYVVDNPNRFHLAINSAIQEGLQRVTEVAESDVEDSIKARAWRTYNLAREFASTANHANEVGLMLLAAQVRKVVNSI